MQTCDRGIKRRIRGLLEQLENPDVRFLAELAFRIEAVDTCRKNRKRIPPVRHTYRTRDGLIPWNRVMDADGKLRPIYEVPEARLRRVVISLPRDGNWYRIKGTHGLARRRQRGLRRRSLYAWLRRLGYTNNHVEIAWTVRGLSVRWLVQEGQN